MQVVWGYKYGLNNKDITINTKVLPFILLKEFMILFFKNHGRKTELFRDTKHKWETRNSYQIRRLGKGVICL